MTNKQIDNIFTYHRPDAMKHLGGANQSERYEIMRDQAKNLAHTINQLTPESREKSLAMTHLQTAVMFANASIAVNEGGPLETTVEELEPKVALDGGETVLPL